MATVREIRKQKQLTLHQLAKRAGVGYVTLQRLETGGTVNRATAQAVAQALGVPLSDISGANVLDRSRRVVP